MAKKKILVVANRTADSPDLIEALRGLTAEESIAFTLLVPAVPHGLDWAADMKAGWSEAALRANRAGSRIRQSGVELEEVIVGDPDPFAAVGDVLHTREIDEVIVSTLPRTISRWLAVGLPARLRRAVDLPVSEITAHQWREPAPTHSPEMAAA
jgi:aconitase B